MITEKSQSNGDNLHVSQVTTMELRKKPNPPETVDNSTTANGVGDENHNEIQQIEEYNNCTHGDLADYTCVECLYNKWRSQANLKKPVPPVRMESVVIIDDDDEDEKPTDRLKNITIERVTEKVKTEKTFDADKAFDKLTENVTVETPESRDNNEEKSVRDDKDSAEKEVKEDVKEEVVNPMEIINSVNWLEVFKFVGISIPVINIE